MSIVRSKYAKAHKWYLDAMEQYRDKHSGKSLTNPEVKLMVETIMLPHNPTKACLNAFGSFVRTFTRVGLASKVNGKTPSWKGRSQELAVLKRQCKAAIARPVVPFKKLMSQ